MEQLELRPGLGIAVEEFSISFARGSGPGGQNVNKVNSKALLTWDLGQTRAVPAAVLQRLRARYHHRIGGDDILLVTSDRFRDQRRNVEDCLDKLKAMLLSVLDAPKPRRATKPSRGSVERRLAGKKADKARKQNRRLPQD